MSRSGSGHSFYIDTSGANDAALKAGLQWLVDKARVANHAGFVAVSTKQVLENLQRSKFADLFSHLRKHNECVIRQVTITVFTTRQPRICSWDGPILVIYGDEKLFDTVDSIDGCADVLCIPWKKHAANWIETWVATPLGSNPPLASETEEPTSEVALVALKYLTDSVNVGIVNPSDKETAIRTLETLHHKSVHVSPENIKSQLIRLDWSPNHAKKVKDLAEQIFDGRRPRGSKGKADEALWTNWQNERD